MLSESSRLLSLVTVKQHILQPVHVAPSGAVKLLCMAADLNSSTHVHRSAREIAHLYGHTAARSHGRTVTRPHGHTAARSHGRTVTRPHGHTAARSHGRTVTRPHCHPASRRKAQTHVTNSALINSAHAHVHY